MSILKEVILFKKLRSPIRHSRNEDELKSDSVSIVFDPETDIVSGWGACSKSGCPCQGFQGNSYTYWVCTNCGHHYDEHW